MPLLSPPAVAGLGLGVSANSSIGAASAVSADHGADLSGVVTRTSQPCGAFGAVASTGHLAPGGGHDAVATAAGFAVLAAVAAAARAATHRPAERPPRLSDSTPPAETLRPATKTPLLEGAGSISPPPAPPAHRTRRRAHRR